MDGLFLTMPGNILFYKENIIDVPSSSSSLFSITLEFIPMLSVKKILHLIMFPVEYIFSLLVSGVVPDRWRHPIVSAISKEPFNRRGNQTPTTITSFFVRAFEKPVRKHIVRHGESSNIVLVYQHGFWK